MSDIAKSISNPPRTAEVYFMPWAGLTEPFQIGPVRFVPWDMVTVSDVGIREFLIPYFRRYFDAFGKQVKTITIVSLGEPDFRVLTDPSQKTIRRAVDGLLFSTIAIGVVGGVVANNNSFAPPSADRYRLYCQRFLPGDDNISVCSGMNNLIAKYQDVQFTSPFNLGGKFASPDTDLLGGLGRLLDDGSTHQKISERMFRSLEWFRLAHTDTEDVGWQSKCVMMATALEILFQIPEGPGKTDKFVKAVEFRTARTTTKQENRTVATIRGKSKNIDRSLPGWWANDFYDLRSRIVHGDPVDAGRQCYDRWITHLIVADMVLWQSLLQELYDLSLTGDNVRKLRQTFPGTEISSLVREMHEALGWRIKTGIGN